MDVLGNEGDLFEQAVEATQDRMSAYLKETQTDSTFIRCVREAVGMT